MIEPGTRVVRTVHGRDWPGRTKTAPTDTDGQAMVRVDFDNGCSITLPVTALRVEDARPVP